MGFGKFIVGGLCAVGAVVAAPVVLPAAGLAIAGSAVTGTAGLIAGTALMGTSATTAAAVAGVAGTAIAAASEKKAQDKEDMAYARGVRSGSQGKEELKRAYEYASAEKDMKINKQEEIIHEQEEYIQAQDEFIDEEILKNKTQDQRERIVCSSCGKSILKESKFCSFCGSKC